MRVFSLILFALLWMVPSSAHAQVWTIERDCVNIELVDETWDFDGVVFTLDNEGLHAYRADVETPYVVAFNKDNFVEFGSISPNGKYFAVPSGTIRLYVDRLKHGFSVREIRVYSTSPERELLYRIPWSYSVDNGILYIPRWRNEDEVVFQGKSTFQPSVNTSGFNIRTGKAIQAEYQYPDRRIITSPEGTLVQVQEKRIGLFNDDGELVNWIVDFSEYDLEVRAVWLKEKLEQNQMPISVLVNTEENKQENRLFIANFETQTVTDTCIDFSNQPIWSPDEQYIALTIAGGGWLTFYEPSTNTAYVTPYSIGQVQGWYPLEEE